MTDGDIEVIYLEDDHEMTDVQIPGQLKYGHEDPLLNQGSNFYALPTVEVPEPGQQFGQLEQPAKIYEPGHLIGIVVVALIGLVVGRTLVD